MKIVALEEHFVTPEVVEAWKALDSSLQDLALTVPAHGEAGHRLLDLGDERIAAMDAAGIDVSVLSLTSPGLQSLAPEDAVALQRPVNDMIAEAVAKNPNRLQAFATLATPSPNAAAKELERAVTRLGLDGAMLFGRTRERNIDHPDFWPIFEAADALRAPLYLHPQMPSPAVRSAYYSNLNAPLDTAFASFGLGWHYETGIQIARMILAGVFDRFPNLQIITGHWGEVILFYIDRLEVMQGISKLQRPFAEYVREHISITPSGMFNHRYWRWANEVIGPDRMMFSSDYPYVRADAGVVGNFFKADGFSAEEKEKLASGNWERLRANIRR